MTNILDQTAAQNAQRTSVTDLSSIRARAADGALSLDQVRAATEARQDMLLDITAEVEVGAITSGDATTGDAESGILSIDCELPENVDLQDCRLNPVFGG